MMSLEEFKGIIDQVRGHVKIISLWNYGEPFLNKDILKMIHYASSAGIYTATGFAYEAQRTGKKPREKTGKRPGRGYLS
jgi:hypothetical protein